MITANLNIPLTIPYLMQDASKAEYAAIKEVYPNTSLLMCYFHVKKNLHDNWSKYDVPDSLRQELANDTTFLHRLKINKKINLRKIKILKMNVNLNVSILNSFLIRHPLKNL